jgi:hypothetical protein
MRIGLTQRVLLHRDRAYDSLEHSWYEYLQGHTLVSIPNRLPYPFPDIDALIVTGGDDHPVRNQVEHELIDIMLARRYSSDRHLSWMSIVDTTTRWFCCACGWITRTVITKCFIMVNRTLVNSYHKLRIERSPPGATVLAHDPDGHAEAWIQEKLLASCGILNA